MEKMKIELSKEDYDFLKELSHEMKTQDNRATADPYYYTVCEKKSVTGMDAAYSDDPVFVRQDGNDYEEYETKEDALRELMKEGMTLLEALVYFDENFDKFGKYEYHVNHNTFLTYKGFLQHMRLNGHNYSYAIDDSNYTEEDDRKYLGGVCSKVVHAWRNPELKRLLEIIHKIGNQDD